ncbi:hypothetical protein BD309DRAFT_945972 [Dichomitus squalens]|uniref:Uncharacterized protein n=1 Tax=Dichomitus squalens TaxID=114155 RepID=A0A4Q9QEJ7_9APHY|nr:hypothetical protein BD309DRAFT_945972 [Dichomitus squalens]TBU66155.1 hypothetical protein BD310DRAFT_912879 [Dichomitus squalens]
MPFLVLWLPFLIIYRLLNRVPPRGEGTPADVRHGLLLSSLLDSCLSLSHSGGHQASLQASRVSPATPPRPSRVHILLPPSLFAHPGRSPALIPPRMP